VQLRRGGRSVRDRKLRAVGSVSSLALLHNTSLVATTEEHFIHLFSGCPFRQAQAPHARRDRRQRSPSTARPTRATLPCPTAQSSAHQRSSSAPAALHPPLRLRQTQDAFFYFNTALPPSARPSVARGRAGQIRGASGACAGRLAAQRHSLRKTSDPATPVMGFAPSAPIREHPRSVRWGRAVTFILSVYRNVLSFKLCTQIRLIILIFPFQHDKQTRVEE
jgi:hypothetical protein